MKGASSAEQYIIQNPQWSACLVLLRELVLSVPYMEENIKWGIPVYSYKDKNVAGIAAFKNHCALWFYQGALLKDIKGVLVNAQEEVTNAMRQWRFEELSQIEQNIELIQAYLEESKKKQDAGLVIKPLKDKPLIIPVELQSKIDEDVELAKAFDSFTKSKKREFTMHIEQAKRSATKVNRLQKIIPMIKAGVGLHDKYR